MTASPGGSGARQFVNRPQAALQFVIKAAATLFFSGYTPLAPGTAGSAVVAVLYFYLGSSLGVAEWLVVLATTFVVGVYTAHCMEREWGKDPGRVVIDEGVGYLVTVAFLPHSLGVAAAAFFLFRVFDVVKPTPVRQLERLPGGWGIVLDDVMAGVYGNLLIRIALLLGVL